ncbi:methyl-accepting chemotaxis protein [Pantoea eucalypti]|jgi:methyl-accepting chemotaxis protein-3 (ribose and galactose sensor receptor)|uniref:HAMP domain-containing protein n=2 Tax=Pseudomonadota TaxID=1224 RepID=A0ABY2ZPR7_9GAMM|nr:MULTISPECIES: methyl-accepting chemotaxis protein [Pantoea]PQL29924.1 HAMP domain-containing protein [Pantoea ananatis]QXG56265.1 Tar ligand binding domain-containing protein [Pantoea jilinensis]AWP32802.1 methyl-accepting chemotaxis protein [Pantoea vagans]EFM20791.1 methyl-accepting chemotaxis sensory transducer [Pantoea sp. aB]ELP23950.1 Methyl-accepting chemotaxis protein I (serine chemoreceptor protein) [Pantoea agglomerans 299R]
MSLKKSSLMIFSFLLALFLTSVAISTWLLIQSNHSLNAVNKEIRVVLSVIDPINHSRTLRVRLMEYMKEIEGSDANNPATLDSVRTVAGKADAAFQAYMNAPRLPGEEAEADAYSQAYLAYRQQGLQPLIDAAEAHDQVRFKSQIPNVVRLDRQYEIILDRVLAQHETYAKKLNSDAQSHFTAGITLLGLFGVLFFAIIIAIYIFMKRYVLSPLNDAQEHCKLIAAGVLDTTVPARSGSRSEIQLLMGSLEQMRSALTTIILQVRDSTRSVSTASQEIAAGNIDLASRTEQQAAALTETAASMEQLGATVKQNTENVFEACRLTSEAVKNAESGEKVSQEVVTSMALINASSKKIEEITTVIDSIAFQTNILALNAAVEAARAGEQGRGFAVVAGEVRNLAQRSATAAKEIEGLIAESVSIIHAGSDQVSRTGDAMSAIISSVSRVNLLMEHISTASDEQSRGIGQIEQAVTEMDSVTQQNSALVQESAAASASLEEQVQYLTQSVSTFRLATH